MVEVIGACLIDINSEYDGDLPVPYRIRIDYINRVYEVFYRFPNKYGAIMAGSACCAEPCMMLSLTVIRWINDETPERCYAQNFHILDDPFNHKTIISSDVPDILMEIMRR